MFGSAVHATERAPKDAHYFLLRLDPSTKQLSIRGYLFAEPDKASVNYLETERAIQQSGADAVLVPVESLEALRRAYPSYFLDTDVLMSNAPAGEREGLRRSRLGSDRLLVQRQPRTIPERESKTFCDRGSDAAVRRGTEASEVNNASETDLYDDRRAARWRCVRNLSQRNNVGRTGSDYETCEREAHILLSARKDRIKPRACLLPFVEQRSQFFEWRLHVHFVPIGARQIPVLKCMNQ